MFKRNTRRYYYVVAYADGHKGLVLQFDKDRLESYGYCKKVEYYKDYPTLRDLNESKLSNEGMTKLFFLRCLAAYYRVVYSCTIFYHALFLK